MTDSDIFKKFSEKNNWGDSDCIELSAKQLEKIILTACKYARESGWEDGREEVRQECYQEGFERGKVVANNLNKAVGGSFGAGADIFDKMFGGKK